MSPYARFVAMILVAAVLMFGLMYLNTWQWSHVRFSQTRLFMTLIMAGAMTLVMLAFMHRMYTDRRANLALVFAGVALIGAGLALVRSQGTVDDVAWMRAMIPHHSIAVLTSERARIADPRVRALADQIIETQRREIAQMETLIASLQAGDAPAP